MSMHTHKYETEAQNHTSRPKHFGKGTLMNGWLIGFIMQVNAENWKPPWVQERRIWGIIKHLLQLENNFLFIQTRDLPCLQERTSSKSCWASLKVGHTTVEVIDVTGATSTIRGELVDVRQCHCAQWNIHRSALSPSLLTARVSSPHFSSACTHRSQSKGPIG